MDMEQKPKRWIVWLLCVFMLLAGVDNLPDPPAIHSRDAQSICLNIHIAAPDQIADYLSHAIVVNACAGHPTWYLKAVTSEEHAFCRVVAFSRLHSNLSPPLSIVA
jgi:hypothetical protein